MYVGTDLDVDGTTNLNAVDIDGAVQIDNTVTVGANDTGYDVKFWGATANAYMEWDESEDDLKLGDYNSATTLLIADGAVGAPGIRFTGNTGTGLGIYRNTTDVMGFVAGGAVRQTIHAAGTGLNTCATGTGNDIHVNTGTGILVQNSSSLRYKNVASVNMADYLTASMVDSLEPKMFSYKSDTDNHPMVGLIAEDCDSVSPFLAVHNPNGESETTDKNALIALLVIGLKDARTRIAALEA